MSAVVVARVQHGDSSPFFFFFQAEDGIRDLTVTGVQTCALPILLALAGRGRTRTAGAVLAAATGLLVIVFNGGYARSGERRVGEEGRTRGAPDHLKKKKINTVTINAR